MHQLYLISWEICNMKQEFAKNMMLKSHWQSNDICNHFFETDFILGCANKDLWALCAPIFIIVVYCRTATTYFFGGKEELVPVLQFYSNRNRCAKVPKWPYCLAYFINNEKRFTNNSLKPVVKLSFFT